MSDWSYIEEPGGACPVQAFGVVDGPHGRQHWYFRARGGAWTLDVGPARGEHGYVPDETAVWSAYGPDATGGHGDYWRASGPDRVTPPLIAEVLGLYLTGHPGGDVGLTMRRREVEAEHDPIGGVTWEVWGLTGDDAEQCASADDEDEAARYATLYAQDYDEVRLYRVERVQELRMWRAGGER